MESYKEKIMKSAFKTAIGIFVGYLLNISKKYILTVPNGTAWVAIIELLPILGFIGNIDQHIPLATAIGYFGVIFLLGPLFMPEYERGLNLIYLIVYILKKIEAF